MLIAIGGLMTVNLEEWVSGDYILFLSALPVCW